MLVLLAVYQNVQQKLYIEIKHHANKYGEFKLTNTHKLHYLRAVVHETFRSKSYDPSFERYILKRNVKINGYNIPKRSLVYGSYTLFMHDSNKWIDPSIQFNVNNFLDDNGHFKANDAFVMFGTGKRSCPGESLGKRNIYYLLASIVLRYKITASNKVHTKVDQLGNAGKGWEELPLIFEKR